MTLIGDYHLSLETALLGLANTLLLLVLIFGRDSMNDLKTVVRYFEMRWEGKTDFEALAMCDRRDMERTAMAALRGVLERQEGCWHCCPNCGRPLEPVGNADTLPTAEHSSGVEEPTVSKTERVEEK